MKTKNKRFFFSGIPSWGLSLITAFFTVVLLIILASFLGSIHSIKEDTGEIIAYIIYMILLISACYFICLNDPKSIWYAPIMCNIPGIISALVEPNFWISPLWILFGTAMCLSIAAGFFGKFKAARINQNSNF